MQEVGLSVEYMNNAELALHVRMLPSLAFVPVADVVTAFNDLVQNVNFPPGNNNGMQQVFIYSI